MLVGGEWLAKLIHPSGPVSQDYTEFIWVLCPEEVHFPESLGRCHPRALQSRKMGLRPSLPGTFRNSPHRR